MVVNRYDTLELGWFLTREYTVCLSKKTGMALCATYRRFRIVTLDLHR